MGKIAVETRQDLTRQLRNAERRLGRLRHARACGPEAREALESAPLAQGAMAVVAGLDRAIAKEEGLISSLSLERKRARL